MKAKKPVIAATMKDVAEKAKVSTATVSRALMNPEKVSQATRNRVEEAAVALGYATFTEFFIYLIQNHAPQVLQEHVHIQLSHAQFEQFV